MTSWRGNGPRPNRGPRPGCGAIRRREPLPPPRGELGDQNLHRSRPTPRPTPRSPNGIQVPNEPFAELEAQGKLTPWYTWGLDFYHVSKNFADPW